MMPRRPPKNKCSRMKKKTETERALSEERKSKGSASGEKKKKKSRLTKFDRFMKAAFPLEDHAPWQEPYIFVQFSDGKVREKLNQMMGTDIVKLSDREFMGQLAINRSRLYEDNLRKRIRERMDWELERRKQLILDGVLPISEGCTGLTDHPIIKLTTEVKDIVHKRKAVLERQAITKRKVPHFNYRLIDQSGDIASTPSDLSLVSSKDSHLPDIIAEARELHREVLETDKEEAPMDNERIMDMYVYVPPDVKRLKESTTVDEMYQRADEVLGQWALDKEDEGSEEGSDEEVEQVSAVMVPSVHAPTQLAQPSTIQPEPAPEDQSPE